MKVYSLHLYKNTVQAGQYFLHSFYQVIFAYKMFPQFRRISDDILSRVLRFVGELYFQV